MTFSPSIADVPLTVVLDIRYPQAYLALPPVVALARSLDVAIDWLPLPVATLKPPAPLAPHGVDEDRGLRHRRYRALSIASEIETYSAVQGLVLQGYYRDGEATALNLGWLWMRDRHPQRLETFLSEAFRAYWALELQPNLETDVVALIDSFDCDATAFSSWAATEGPALAATLVDALHERGVFAVPTYLVEDELFLGRQHLPMIRWILEGRTGAVPI